MKKEIKLAEHFGSFCADGSLAASFRMGHIEPFLGTYGMFEFDLEGVRNMNDSFANALIAPLVEQMGNSFKERLKFKGYNENTKLAVIGALSLGIQRMKQAGNILA